MSGSRFLAPTTPGAMLSPGAGTLTASEQLVLQQIDNNLFFVIGEVPTGTVDGVNAVFTTAHTVSPTNSIDVFVNGQRVYNGGTGQYDYVFSSTNTTTFNNAPPLGSLILVNYLRHP